MLETFVFLKFFQFHIHIRSIIGLLDYNRFNERPVQSTRRKHCCTLASPPLFHPHVSSLSRKRRK